jgi:hypothetical protein
VKHIHIDTVIAKDILQKGTRGSFYHWVRDDFLQLVGSLPLEEQKLWLPNQLAHDPDFWTTPHFLNLKTGYDILVNKHDCKVQEMYTVQDHPPSRNESLLLPTLDNLHKAHERNQQLILQVDYTMILVVYYFCTLAVKFRLLLTKYRRNRINFDSFVRPAMLILKGQWG